MTSPYNLDNPVFTTFCFYAGLLGVKLLMMSFLTSKKRFVTKAFASPEDLKFGGKKMKVDEEVERVRRAHLNDLENILPFLILGLLYVGIGPSAHWAKMLFRIFTAARFVHTFVYAIVVIPQPARALSFMVGTAVNIYMAYSIITACCSAM